MNHEGTILSGTSLFTENVTDRPYRELVEAAKATHRRVMEVHAGKTPPVARQAKMQ